jgi:large subunit ribosomal protein L9
MALTEIILKENIPGLGAEADIVKVRTGYARNFLVPKGKAYEVTPGNLKRLTQLQGKRSEREAQELNEAEEFARRINKAKLDFTLEAGETGKAFGSVSVKDIEDKLQTEHGITLDRHRLQLDRPIKESGFQEIPVRLHADVTATLRVEVKVHVKEVAPEPVSPESDPGRARARRKPRTTAT